ncbi:helix-turn-helix transcriptional regulator [Nocardia farcinica]|uniref:helix-turn-helix domain-containing protein n=1 Tax=Nocardia farcinica TaxID=37329 RepID=UPI001893C5C1|nr:helix-turn-helix transcriptional regulator [Nocardia farcinica]MBF6363191.1 helix-turn-helix transcriptional regulator [Nocardia farcinica]
MNLLRILQHRWEHQAMGIRDRRGPKTRSQLLASELAREELELKRALIRAREKANLNQAELAKKIGVHRSVISRFERMDSNPRLSMLRYYAHALGVLIKHQVVPFHPAATRTEVFDLAFPDTWFVTRIAAGNAQVQKVHSEVFADQRGPATTTSSAVHQ